MKKNQRNKKRTKEQKVLVRQRRSGKRIMASLERATRRKARIIAAFRQNQEHNNATLDNKIDNLLTSKIAFPDTDVLGMYVLIGYNSIFGKKKQTSFGELLDDTPTLAAVNFVVEHMDKYMYSQTAPKKIRTQIMEFASYLSVKEKRKLCNLLRRFHAVVFNNLGCLRFVYYAMQNYRPMPQGDYILSEDEKRRIYRCLTYCNQMVTDEQVRNIKINRENAIEAMMAVDMMIVEFKTFKFFQTQLVKALRFFEFCEKPLLEDTPKAKAMQEDYRHYMDQFCQDMGVEDWKQYLRTLGLMITSQVKHGRLLRIKNGETDPFIQSMMAKSEKFQGLEYENALKYLREHFMWQVNADWDTAGIIPDNEYLILNSNLLVDRLYQGMLFSFCRSMNKYRKKQGKKVLDFKDFKGSLGKVFSEPRLFYPVMERVFNNERYKCVSGNELEAKFKIKGTSDYYIQVEDKLLLFEFKDTLLGDKYKYSHDMQLIVNEVLHRICNPGSSKDDDNRKGVYQLIDTVIDLDSTSKYGKTGIAIENAKTIYPIVVITDTAFSANGVNAVVTKEYKKSILPTCDFKHDFQLSTPIVMHIDTIMNIAKQVSEGHWNFEEMLDGYLHSIEKDDMAVASTFDGFVVDEYIHKEKFDENGVLYIYGDDLKLILS